MTAALEAAECGKQVILVERNATLGGRTALLYRYFPKMCHPTCGLEINLRRLKGNRNARVMTMTEVVDVKGRRGDYTVTLKLSPRNVNASCTACGDCATAVEAEMTTPTKRLPQSSARGTNCSISLDWQLCRVYHHTLISICAKHDDNCVGCPKIFGRAPYTHAVFNTHRNN